MRSSNETLRKNLQSVQSSAESSGKGYSVISGISGFHTPSVRLNTPGKAEYQEVLMFEPRAGTTDPFEAAKEIMTAVFEYFVKYGKRS